MIVRHLAVPAVSKSLNQVKKHFGFTAPFVEIDNPASSRLTKERPGRKITHEGFIPALNQSNILEVS